MFAILDNIFNFFKRLFGIIPRKSEIAQTEQNRYAETYKDTSKPLNITAVAALKLTNICVSEAKIGVRGKSDDSPRIMFLNSTLQRIVNKIDIIIARTLGIGGVVIKPYIVDGEIYLDVLPQTSFFVVEQVGEVVKKAGFVVDYIKKDNAFSAEYIRLEYHSLDENGNYIIENKALKNNEEIPLTAVEAWAEIPPAVTITGVSQMLFAFIKCPVDNRKTELNSVDNIYGVPVTFGQDNLIETANKLLNEIPDEYINKKAFIGADELLFDSKNKLPDSGKYKVFRPTSVDKAPLWEIFSPEIRHTSYFEGIDYYLGLIEKAIGLSKGTLTDMITGTATATEIERGSFDTEAFADRVHKNIEAALRQLVYAFDILANAFNLSPFSSAEYEVSCDWSNWSEKSLDRWKQLIEGKAVGAVHVYELRMWLYNEDKETAIANSPAQISDMPVAVGE